MQGSLDDQLKTNIKEMIIEACELEIDPYEIEDEGPLFGSESNLGLDSIDGLQIAVAIQNKYGMSITDSKKMRKVMQSINTFADFIQPE